MFYKMIEENELRELLRDSMILNNLLNMGVDNWPGFTTIIDENELEEIIKDYPDVNL